MLSNIAWYLYIHVTIFVAVHPLAFAAIAVGGFALIHFAEKSLKARR